MSEGQSIDDAWIEAVDALPDDSWYVFGVRAVPMGRAEWAAKYAVGLPDHAPMWWNAAARGAVVEDWRVGQGPTPADALRDLAARLREHA